MIERLRVVTVVLLFLLSLAAILIGFLADETGAVSPLQMSMLSVGGAALFGASLTMMIEQFLGTEITDIRKYLIARERFDSAPDHLTDLVGSWHVYYLSKSESGRLWRHVEYTFHLADRGHSLKGAFNVVDDSKRRHTYTLSAGIRGDSLIIFSRATKGQEPDSAEIIFRITADHLASFLGIQKLVTWDGAQALSYTIFSRDRLVDKPSITPDDFDTLDNALEALIQRERLIDLRNYIPD